MNAVAEFLKVVQKNQIEPVIRNSAVRSPSVTDCSDVRRAAVAAAAQAYITHPDCGTPRRMANILNAVIRAKRAGACDDAAIEREDGFALASADFSVFADDFQHAIWAAALTENETWKTKGRAK